MTSQFDFKDVHLFARRYLETYYLNVNEDEPPIASFLLEKCKTLPQGLCALEIGCGPTVHHALPIAPYVSSIDMADYLTDNLAEIKKWKEASSEAFSWHHYTRMVLEGEGIVVTDEIINVRENLLREKMRHFYNCDVTKAPPLNVEILYPLVLTFYCAEEVGTTGESWETMMSNISMMVAPGGHLFLSALRDTSKYILGDPSGEHEWLPCAQVTEASLQQCLEKLGYLSETIDIRSIDTPGLVNMGIPGILTAAAKKSS